MSVSVRKSLLFALILFLISFAYCTPAAYSALQQEGFDEHFIEVILDLEQRRLIGKDTITFAGLLAGSYTLLIDKDIRINRVELSGFANPLPYRTRISYENKLDTILKELIISVPADLSRVELTIYFDAAILPIQSAQKRTERGVSFSGISVMGELGAFFPASSFWFPRRASPFAFYDIVVSLPLGFEAVMEGELLERKHSESRSLLHYKTNTPNDGINLVAARFVVKSERYKGIDIYTYFFSDDEKLSRTYIEKTKYYIDLYDGIFPPYPYKKFAIVENFLPTGFGMPSFTLLGSAVLRLPFIPDTALGHEFAHNWWGNGVFIDASSGNWAEALTAYTADHLFRDRVAEKEAAAYRMRALNNYANYARESTRPVSSFKYGTSTEARALGYSKAMMIFHMLRGLVGDELFYSSLEKFYLDNAFTRASWEDIRLAFEEVSKRELGWFFDEWLLRAGGPRLSIEKPAITTSSKGFSLTLVINQEPPVYRLKVPVLIETSSGVEHREVLINKSTQEFKFDLDERPVSIEVDPENDIFRLLSASEVPPSLASILGSSKSVLILPKEARYREKYRLIAEKIKRDFALSIKDDTVAFRDDLTGPGPSYFILGGHGENALFARVKEWLPEELQIEKGYFLVDGVRFDNSQSVLVAALSAGSSGRSVAVLFGGLSAKELERIGERISHLTSKGYLVFTRGGGLKHGTFEGGRSLRYELP